MTTPTITLQVNGEPQSCLEGTTLPQLLQQLDMDPRLVAVEYNGEILHRQFWETTRMEADDRLEVVTIVGGGSNPDILASTKGHGELCP